MKLAPRLLFLALGLVMLPIVPSVMIIDMRLRERMLDERAEALKRDARLIADHWAVEKRPQETAARAATTLGGRVTLIDRAGIIVGDAATGHLKARQLGQRAVRPEVAEARNETVGIRLERSGVDTEELYVAVRTAMGIVRIGVETASLARIFDAARRDLVAAGLLGVAIAALFAVAFAHYVSKPVIQLRDMAHGLSRNEFVAHSHIRAPGEVGELAESLTHLSLRLQALEGVRRDFIANVSHELLSPLSIASGFAATLARHDPPADQRRQFAQAILSNTSRMQRVIDDMLDLSRIESGRWMPRPEVISLPDIASEVINSLRPAADEKGIALVTDLAADATLFDADRTAVRQTLANLSENSMRHTDRGSITIFSERTAEGVWVGVRDTGEGVDALHLPRIFERFYRVDSGRARESGGSGLGLAIVKHMVEAHGGRVDAESEPGKGSTIRALFPQPIRPRRPTPVGGIGMIIDQPATLA